MVTQYTPVLHNAVLYDLWITLNGRPAGWRAVLLNEKHEFSAGWQAAQKDRLAGCTTGWASGLHIKVGRQAAH